MSRTLSCSFLAVGVFACAPSGPTYHQDVAPLVAARCTNCHQAGGVAPFALTDFKAVQTFGPAMVAAVEAGRMPPWKAADADVHYLRNPTLSAEQLATLKSWVAGGMPEGDARARPIAVAPITGGIERVDLELQMPEAYTPTRAPDDYRCFVLRWPGLADVPLAAVLPLEQAMANWRLPMEDIVAGAGAAAVGFDLELEGIASVSH